MSDAVIDQLAERVAQNKTQRSVVVKALREYETLLRASRSDASLVERRPSLLTPRADTVVFVLSGENVGDRATVEMRQRLDYTLGRRQGVHVVTAGRMGVEIAAKSWCSQNGQPYSEIAAMWASPNGDGTTTRQPNARNPRNQKLREFCQRAVEADVPCLVWSWGEERRNDAIEGLLVKAGAIPRLGSPHWSVDKHQPLLAALAPAPQSEIEL